MRQRRRAPVITLLRGVASMRRMDELHHDGGIAGAAARRPLRIAVVTETYPPEVNGVSVSLARVVDALRGRGHDVRLVRPRQGADGDGRSPHDAGDRLVAGVPIPGYGHLRMGLSSARALRAWWSQWRPDVVHIVTEGPLGWSALRAARRLRLAVTSDFRTNFHSYSGHYGIGWLQRPIAAYLRHFHNRTHCTMVPTAALRAQLQAAGFERLAVVGRGVDTTLFHPGRRSPVLRHRWGVDEGGLAVLYVGRLAAEKNLQLLIDAWRAMNDARPGTRLVLVGDGPLRARLEAQCPQAVFAGVRRGDELAACYASADVFVFPSLTETYGNVTPEAMASALAVLAFDHAAAGQLITDGLDGCLVRAGDAAGFVERARALALDPDRRRELGREARRSARALDWDRVVDAVEYVFASAALRASATRHAADAGLGDAAAPLVVPREG
jgi:glycosyltransferase involved in cell wall biosynthesis